jgi:hypothetical protein
MLHLGLALAAEVLKAAKIPTEVLAGTKIRFTGGQAGGRNRKTFSHAGTHASEPQPSAFNFAAASCPERPEDGDMRCGLRLLPPKKTGNARGCRAVSRRCTLRSDPSAFSASMGGRESRLTSAPFACRFATRPEFIRLFLGESVLDEVGLVLRGWRV